MLKADMTHEAPLLQRNEEINLLIDTWDTLGLPATIVIVPRAVGASYNRVVVCACSCPADAATRLSRQIRP
jgi:hypothetical protein